jgi:hypothetical protein
VVEAAYGMPRNSRYYSVTVPRTGPASVGTISVAAAIATPSSASTWREIIVATPDAVVDNARNRRTRAGLLTAWSLLEELLVDRG